jgi:peptide deformylase
VPNNYAKVERAETVTVKATNIDGDEFTRDADGLLAICIQHELDHLVGKLFVDYLSPLKRQRIQKKLEKEAKLAARA